MKSKTVSMHTYDWNYLLRETETSIPEKVLTTIGFFEKKDIWFKVSRNEEATTCVDAASKRIRNEKKGIPLEDELKTCFCEHKLINGKKQLLLINIPGNCFLDFKFLRTHLFIKGGISWAGERTMKLFKIKFGEVNPFLVYEEFDKIPLTENIDKKLEVLFDKTLLNKNSTMFTNAGELNWAVEFKVNDVVKQFKFSKIANLVSIK
jgi:prolyl-tRNA editing enzyme YbaK/EbsC (Cys-tRNA(Pro) deacylase)